MSLSFIVIACYAMLCRFYILLRELSIMSLRHQMRSTAVHISNICITTSISGGRVSRGDILWDAILWARYMEWATHKIMDPTGREAQGLWKYAYFQTNQNLKGNICVSKHVRAHTYRGFMTGKNKKKKGGKGYELYHKFIRAIILIWQNWTCAQIQWIKTGKSRGLWGMWKTSQLVPNPPKWWVELICESYGLT